MLHINVQDILCSSRIILTAGLSDHSKTFFGGLAFTHFIQETWLSTPTSLLKGLQAAHKFITSLMAPFIAKTKLY